MRGFEQLGVDGAFDAALDGQHDGGGDDRAGQRSASDLVDPRDVLEARPPVAALGGEGDRPAAHVGGPVRSAFP